MGSIRNKNYWNDASKRLFGSYSHSGIPEFPFRLFYSQVQNSRNIFRNIFRNKFLFRNIPNERALRRCLKIFFGRVCLYFGSVQKMFSGLFLAMGLLLATVRRTPQTSFGHLPNTLTDDYWQSSNILVLVSEICCNI